MKIVQFWRRPSNDIGKLFHRKFIRQSIDRRIGEHHSSSDDQNGAIVLCLMVFSMKSLSIWRFRVKRDPQNLWKKNVCSGVCKYFIQKMTIFLGPRFFDGGKWNVSTFRKYDMGHSTRTRIVFATIGRHRRFIVGKPMQIDLLIQSISKENDFSCE